MLLVGDALHTQKDTVKIILKNHADYLLFAKDNQEQLVANLEIFFRDLPFGSITETTTAYETQRKRDITCTIVISHDMQICKYLGWDKIKTVGKIHRVGTRISSDGQVKIIDETVYCISSRNLTAKELAEHSRSHWQIENNLHWQKDWLYLEDRQTLRTGNAPQIR